MRGKYGSDVRPDFNGCEVTKPSAKQAGNVQVDSRHAVASPCHRIPSLDLGLIRFSSVRASIAYELRPDKIGKKTGHTIIVENRPGWKMQTG